MELNELVERIQRWKARHAAESGEGVAPDGEAPYAQAEGYEEVPMAEVAAVDEQAEPMEYQPDEGAYAEAEPLEAADDELSDGAAEEVSGADVEEVAEPIEEESAWDEDDNTSEVSLDQIEDMEEVE